MGRWGGRLNWCRCVRICPRLFGLHCRGGEGKSPSRKRYSKVHFPRAFATVQIPCGLQKSIPEGGFAQGHLPRGFATDHSQRAAGGGAGRGGGVNTGATACVHSPKFVWFAKVHFPRGFAKVHLPRLFEKGFLQQ